MKFSTHNATFSDWLKSQSKQSSYTKRITRLHSFYPKATLDQLRGHAKTRARTLSKAQPVPLHRRSWASLTRKEKENRERSLEVLSLARKNGTPLSQLSKEHQIAITTVLRNTNAFRKANGRWRVKKYDRISRIMAIYEEGKEVFVEITDSRQASIVGRYQSAIGQYLEKGDIGVLEEFKGKMVRDSNGNYHLLETSPEAIRAINERRETEFPPIYEGLNESL